METDTYKEKEKSYQMSQFLDSLNKTYGIWRSKVQAKSNVTKRINRLNEIKKKRELLKIKVKMVEQETGIIASNVESLLSELLKKDQISVYAFLDQQESDQIS